MYRDGGVNQRFNYSVVVVGEGGLLITEVNVHWALHRRATLDGRLRPSEGVRAALDGRACGTRPTRWVCML